MKNNNIALSVEESKISCIPLRQPKRYAVDFNKVNNFDDLKNVVQILFTGLPITIGEDYDFINEIIEYLVETE